MNAAIEVKDVSLTFSIYRNRSPQLKERLVTFNNRIEQSLDKVLKFLHCRISIFPLKKENGLA